MKTKFVLILALMSSSVLYSQKFTFTSYGLVNNYTNGSVVNAPANLSLENKGEGNYQIIVLDPHDGSVAMNALIKYKLYNSEREYYVYEGTLKFGEIDYNCIIRTNIKMSDFIQGNGNNDNFVFEKKYEIKVFHSRYGKTIDDMDEIISLYPINIKK